MGAGKSLHTWSKRGRFSYVGSFERGMKVSYGHNDSFIVPPSVYADLFRVFGGRDIAIGLSLRPPRESLGAFLAARLGRQGLAAYVGPILVHEGAAERLTPQKLRIREALPDGDGAPT